MSGSKTVVLHGEPLDSPLYYYFKHQIEGKFWGAVSHLDMSQGSSLSIKACFIWRSATVLASLTHSRLFPSSTELTFELMCAKKRAHVSSKETINTLGENLGTRLLCESMWHAERKKNTHMWVQKSQLMSPKESTLGENLGTRLLCESMWQAERSRREYLQYMCRRPTTGTSYNIFTYDSPPTVVAIRVTVCVHM